MKSPEEIKSASQLLSALISGHWPIRFNKQGLRVLEAQCHVLRWVQNSDPECFQGSMDSLKALLDQIRFHEEGRAFKSKALAE